MLAVVALIALVGGGMAMAGTAFPSEIPVERQPCDPLDPQLCLLPFPNDRFTTSDDDRDSGRRINFLPVEMPRVASGKPIDPTEWNRNDGFSPGSMVLTFVPRLDLHRTWGTSDTFVDDPRRGGPNDPRDHIAAIGRYKHPRAPIMIIEAETGDRWPFWSELDMNASTQDDERLLILRPAKNFREGHRYLVALRDMRDTVDAEIEAGAHFSAYRDGTSGPALDPTFEESRRTEVNRIIEEIEEAEVGRNRTFHREDLFLAWEFTVASERNLSERVLRIRDESFGELGDHNLADGVISGSAPQFRITLQTPNSGSSQRRVEGVVSVPNYLDRPPLPLATERIPLPVPNPVGSSLPNQAIPGGRFLYGLEELPMRNSAIPTIEIPFLCTIPAVASKSNPAQAMLYGHGLLGSRSESAGGSGDRMRERNFMPCAVNWMGFAEYDVANALATLVDPSNMPSMIDRSQQGFLNWMIFSRALVHPQGLATDPAFQTQSGEPLFHTGKLVYDGNSQGGIMGGALTALSPDFTRAVLGVPGMNYSTLLNRSVDWEGPLFDPDDPDLPAYSSFLYTMFPNKKEQQLVIALLQMLWDRGEGNGYAQHMSSDPLTNTPAHRVLLHVAYGDFQVANASAEVEARTIGARIMDTALTVIPDRHWAVQPFFGLKAIPKDDFGKPLPWAGSAIVYWDSGNLSPPNANVPPLLNGGDPHEDPRRDPFGADQKAHFYLTGEVKDVFNGGPYLLCRPGQEGNIPRWPALFTFDWCPRNP